jgi:GNAT superfamily N-acetyltransferase
MVLCYQVIQELRLSSSSSIFIRAATESDLIDAARIFQTVVSSAQWLPESSRSATDLAAASEGEDISVAYRKTTGVCGFISVWRPQSFIHHLYVDPRCHRQGVGTALLASLADWLPAPWTLKCAAANTSALAFYTAHGWKPIDTGISENGKYILLEYPPSVASSVHDPVVPDL